YPFSSSTKFSYPKKIPSNRHFLCLRRGVGLSAYTPRIFFRCATVVLRGNAAIPTPCHGGRQRSWGRCCFLYRKFSGVGGGGAPKCFWLKELTCAFR